MKYYLLLFLSCLLGGGRLIFHKLFVKRFGAGAEGAMWFSVLSSLLFVGMMLAIGQTVTFTAFSVGMAFLFAVANVICNVCGFASLTTGTVSAYTLFLQLGGMLIPFLYGVTLANETPSVPKLICIVLITAALAVSVGRPGKEGSARKALGYNLGIFLANGFACIVLSLHQAEPTPFGGKAVDSTAFTLLYVLFTALISLIIALFYLWRRRPKGGEVKKPLLTREIAGKALLFSAGFGIFYGLGNLLVAIGLLHIETSAQFPILTGGSLVVAGIVGLFFGEKITRRFLLSAALVLVGTLLLLPW